jgi:hypothetical protein
MTCALCRGRDADGELFRTQVWEDRLCLPEEELRAVAERVRVLLG